MNGYAMKIKLLLGVHFFIAVVVVVTHNGITYDMTANYHVGNNVRFLPL